MGIGNEEYVAMEQGEVSNDALNEGKAEELSPGEVWSIGNFEVYALGGMMSGLQLVGEAEDGREVTLNLRPGEVKALGGLIQAHEGAIEDGVERYKNVKGAMGAVMIRVPGSGPQPIPTNKSVLPNREAEEI